MLHKIINALTVTFDQVNACLLNKNKTMSNNNLAGLKFLKGSMCVNHLKGVQYAS